MRRPDKLRLKDGTVTWQLRFPDAHGKIRYKRFGTKREAEAFADEVKKALDAGVDPGRRVLFPELAEEWTASHFTQGLRPSSVKDYKQSLARLSAAFGTREVRSITAADLERVRNALVLAVVAERSQKFDRVIARIQATPTEKRTEHQLNILAREPELRAEIARSGIRAGASKVVGCARTLWKFAIVTRLCPPQHRDRCTEAEGRRAGGNRRR